jgi:hypothetical protein
LLVLHSGTYFYSRTSLRECFHLGASVYSQKVPALVKVKAIGTRCVVAAVKAKYTAHKLTRPSTKEDAQLKRKMGAATIHISSVYGNQVCTTLAVIA